MSGKKSCGILTQSSIFQRYRQVFNLYRCNDRQGQSQKKKAASCKKHSLQSLVHQLSSAEYTEGTVLVCFQCTSSMEAKSHNIILKFHSLMTASGLVSSIHRKRFYAHVLSLTATKVIMLLFMNLPLILIGNAFVLPKCHDELYMLKK